MNKHQVNIEQAFENFPQIENMLHCCIYTHNVKNGRTEWSRGVFAILGLEPNLAEIDMGIFLQFIAREDLNRVNAVFEKSKYTKKTCAIEFSLIDAKGVQKRVCAENYLSFDEKGEMTEYTGVIKDISENFNYEKTIEQKILQLDESNRNLQEFVYAASHDLQDPVRKISTFTEQLGNKFSSQLGDEGNMLVKRILSSARNMQMLLEDLLNFSRVSLSDKNYETISIQTVMQNVLHDLDLKKEEVSVTLLCNKNFSIEAYPSQIKQLFGNLIGNAIKFKKANETALIKISCEEVNYQNFSKLALKKNTSYIQIIVEDNGIGFEQQYAERVFLIFQRLNAKAEYPGSGIGLAICKKIADNHHGFIFANSDMGKGATFTVLLPQKQI